MSAWPIIGRLLGAIPKVIEAIKGSGKKTQLDAPLGESKAARAIRLEIERRADIEAERVRRAKGMPDD